MTRLWAGSIFVTWPAMTSGVLGFPSAPAVPWRITHTIVAPARIRHAWALTSPTWRLTW